MDDCLELLVNSALPSRRTLAQIKSRIPTHTASSPDPTKQVADIFRQAFAVMDRWKMPCGMAAQG